MATPRTTNSTLQPLTCQTAAQLINALEEGAVLLDVDGRKLGFWTTESGERRLQEAGWGSSYSDAGDFLAHIVTHPEAWGAYCCSWKDAPDKHHIACQTCHHRFTQHAHGEHMYQPGRCLGEEWKCPCTHFVYPEIGE